MMLFLGSEGRWRKEEEGEGKVGGEERGEVV